MFVMVQRKLHMSATSSAIKALRNYSQHKSSARNFSIRSVPVVSAVSVAVNPAKPIRLSSCSCSYSTIPSPQPPASKDLSSSKLKIPVQFFLTGLVGSTLGSLLGLGGGVFMVPIMVSLLGVTQNNAHGTSLVAVTTTSIVASYKYFAGNCVEPGAAIVIAVLAVPCALIGAKIGISTKPEKLKRLFGFWLAFASVMIPLRTIIAGLPLMSGNVFGTYDTLYWLVIGGIGTFAGFISGLMGVGGGTAMVPVLSLLGMEQHIAQGTALAGMIIPSAVGSVTHWSKKNIRMDAVLWLVLGTLGGGYLGSVLALQAGETSLRIAFSIALFWIGFRYIRQ